MVCLCQCYFCKKCIKLLNNLTVRQPGQTPFPNDIDVPDSLKRILFVSEIFPDNPFNSVALYCVPNFFRYSNSNSIVFFCPIKDNGNKIASVYLFPLF